METISITYRGLVHKLTEYEKLADTIETIYAMCDQKITHWADSITGKNGGKVKKYKRGKILYNSLKNNELERVSFFSLPENFVTAAFDYTIYISINYKDKYITAVFEKNILKDKKVEAIKNMLSSYMELLEKGLICMEKTDHNAHSVYLMYYHLIMVVKYRRKVIDNPISERARKKPFGVRVSAY